MCAVKQCYDSIRFSLSDLSGQMRFESFDIVEMPECHDVARIDLTPSGFKVTDLTGTVAEFGAEIESIDFVDSVVRIQGRTASFEDAR